MYIEFYNSFRKTVNKDSKNINDRLYHDSHHPVTELKNVNPFFQI